MIMESISKRCRFNIDQRRKHQIDVDSTSIPLSFLIIWELHKECLEIFIFNRIDLVNNGRKSFRPSSTHGLLLTIFNWSSTYSSSVFNSRKKLGINWILWPWSDSCWQRLSMHVDSCISIVYLRLTFGKQQRWNNF